LFAEAAHAYDRPRALDEFDRFRGAFSTRKAGHLYLGSGRPIWNNDGDTVTLIDPHNIAVSRYRY
jgi:hypothetical protein